MNQIMDKISKALKLGTNNTNENEAQNAILAAQKLMAKYHITQEQVNDFISGEDEQTEIIEEQAEKEINNNKWKRCLMVIIAKNFRCDIFYRGNKLILVGTNEDILISKRVYLYAKQVILNSFKEFYKENYALYELDYSKRNRYKREFALGFIRGLAQKFETQKQDSKLSLVVVNPEVKEYLNNIHFAGVHRERPLNITSGFCYKKGKIAGRNLIDIDTRMKGEC